MMLWFGLKSRMNELSRRVSKLFDSSRQLIDSNNALAKWSSSADEEFTFLTGYCNDLSEECRKLRAESALAKKIALFHAGHATKKRFNFEDQLGEHRERIFSLIERVDKLEDFGHADALSHDLGICPDLKSLHVFEPCPEEALPGAVCQNPHKRCVKCGDIKPGEVE